MFPEHAERLRRLPSARHPTKPHAILPAAIEPDYRSRKYLLHGTQFTVVRAPCFHFLGIYGVDRIVIASRPNRVVGAPGPVVHEQTTQFISIERLLEMSVEDCIGVMWGRHRCRCPGFVQKAAGFGN